MIPFHYGCLSRETEMSNVSAFSLFSFSLFLSEFHIKLDVSVFSMIFSAVFKAFALVVI